MTDTKNIRSRGRPRRFDPDQAVATAKQLFHARGFDAVGVAEITSVLGINPPSFYAAFGSKMGIDATRKWESEGFRRPWPDEIVMDSATKQRIDSIWHTLGLQR